MTKHDFLTALTNALKERQIPDAAEIVGEYDEHFSFRLADGFTEEEIAARLGAPEEIAAQYEGGEAAPARADAWLVRAGFCVLDLFAGIFFLVLLACGLVLAAAALTSGAIAVCLVGGLNPFALIPPMPYWCGVMFGLALAALAVLSAAGCVYYGAFIRQLARCFVRFQHNALAAAAGRPVRPAVAARPSMPRRTARRLYLLTMISLTVFMACLVLGYLAAALSAGSPAFWHAFGWFGYTGA